MYFAIAEMNKIPGFGKRSVVLVPEVDEEILEGEYSVLSSCPNNP